MEEKKYLLALSQYEKIGPSRLMRLRGLLGSWQAVWQASTSELKDAGLSAEQAAELTSFRKSFDHPALEKLLEKHGILTVSLEEAGYPVLLKQIYSPPPLLYYKGSLAACALPCLAVVGARRASPYGRRVAEELVAESAALGLAIVSGLALGIDTLAHEAALTAGGRTIAVVGTGLDQTYPLSNRRLAERIAENGCLISEFRPGTPPYKGNFPRRNRLIAGLSRGTLVIEAAIDSGALITARHSLQENREVMAVPGTIHSPLSAGPHDLIQQGGRLVTGSADILAALGIEYCAQPAAVPISLDSPEEEALLRRLSREPVHINELARLTKLDMSAINSRLTIMEMKGLVRNIGNLSYIRLF